MWRRFIWSSSRCFRLHVIVLLDLIIVYITTRCCCCLLLSLQLLLLLLLLLCLFLYLRKFLLLILDFAFIGRHILLTTHHVHIVAGFRLPTLMATHRLLIIEPVAFRALPSMVGNHTQLGARLTFFMVDMIAYSTVRAGPFKRFLGFDTATFAHVGHAFIGATTKRTCPRL